MNKSFPRFSLRRFRTHLALLLAYLMLITPLAPVFAQAVKVKRATAPSTTQGTEQPGKGTTLGIDKHIILPAPNGAATAPVITATKTDNLSQSTQVAPGGTINYTVTITNNGTADATGVVFNDTVDTNTTVDASSAVLAADDDYNTIGNVNISVAAPGLLANDLDIDGGSNVGMTTTAQTKSSASCAGCNNVSINGDGSFSYDPPVGFNGTDTFTYTANTAGGKSATATAHIAVTGRIWFVNNNAGACSSACDGRLSHPFTSLASFQAINDNAATLTHAKTGDNIFIYESSAAYTGPVTLLSSQKLIGQDASATIETITGLSTPSGSTVLPAMNATPATAVNIIGSNANGINLGSGNTLRGFTVGDTGTGIKISGSSFGTLTVGNLTTPDVTLIGTGQALNLITGTFAATSAFSSVTTTSSSTSGLTLTSVAGTVAFGSTTVSGNTAECLVTTSSTADISFGNTSCTGGANGVSLSGNTAGTRTFGTLSVSGGSGNAFVHSGGGGNVTVNGAATLSSAAPDTIVIQNAANGNLINFVGGATVNKTGAGGEGVLWSGTNTGATLTFATLALTTSNGAGMNLAGGGTVNVTNAAGSSISATGDASHNGAAIIANGIALNANFTSVSSTNNGFAGTNGISLTTVTGTSSFGTGTLTGAAGATFLVSGGTATVTYSGNVTQGNNAAAVSVSGGHTTGTITFQTGTVSASNGTGLQFDNADGTYNFNGTTTLNGGNAGVDITNGSAGTFSFSSNTSIGATTSPSGIAFNIDGTAAAVTAGVTYNGTIKQTNASSALVIKSKTGGAASFTGAITATTTTANAIDMPSGNAGSTASFTGGLNITTTSGAGFVATGGGTVNATQDNSTIVNTITTTTGTALNVANTNIGANGITFRSITSNGAPSGINLNSTGTSAGNGGLTVTGNSGTCTLATTTCTGGSIQSSTGAGIALNTTKAVSLSLMKIQNSGTDGINAATVSGFTLNNSIITDTSGVSGDEGIEFTNISGTLTVSNSAVSGSPHHNIKFINQNTNLTAFNLTNTTLQNNLAGTGADGLLFEAAGNLNGTGSSVITGITITGCTFSGNKSTGVQIQSEDLSNIQSATVGTTGAGNGNTFTGNNAGIDIDLSQASSLTFTVVNNNFQTQRSEAINAFAATASTGGSFTGKIQSNIIGTQGTLDSGSAIGSGIRILSKGGAVGSFTVDSNTIREVPNGRGIDLGAHRTASGNGGAKFKVTNNTVARPSGTAQNIGCGANVPCPLASVWVAADNETATGSETVCSVITGNTAYDPTSYANGSEAAYYLQANTFTGPSTQNTEGTNANVATQITSTNTVTNSTASPVIIDTTASVHTVAAGTCGAFPTADDIIAPPPPPPANVEASQQQQPAAAPNDITAQPFVSLPVAAKPAKAEAQVGAAAQIAASRVQPQQEKPQVTKTDASSSKSPRPLVVLSSTAVSANIGTLKVGDSVQINFSVTVNTPFPNGVSTVSNQGTVSGSNFPNVLTDDPDVAGQQATVTQILTPPDIRVNDAKVSEPALNQQTTMLFVVTLNHAFPPTGTSVNFATANGGASPAVGGASCDGSTDYITTSSTLTFGATETLKTIPVTVCGTALASDKTLLLNLSSPSAGNIVDSQAVGTITAANTPGTFLISELRTAGPDPDGAGPLTGAGDDFVELYNNTDSPLTVAASDASAGYGLFKMGADCTAAPILIGTIPNGTVIPARGHYLFVGSQYSLANYGGAGAAAGDQTLTSDIETDANVSVFSTADGSNLSTAARLDAVGYGANTGGNTCDLLREGTTLAPIAAAAAIQHSYFRNLSTGQPKDTNDNASDFLFADTQGTFISGVTQRLGAPGPENKTSPINRGATIKSALLDATVGSSTSPNRVRDLTSNPGNNSTNGTLSIRRRFTNNTGANVTRLRFRVVQITTFPSPGGGVADVRLLTSSDVSQGGINDAATCGGATPCTVTVRGTTLESPPTQPNGGGLNSTVAAGIITTGVPLSPGASINVQFLLGVQTTGNFAFFVIVEALP